MRLPPGAVDLRRRGMNASVQRLVPKTLVLYMYWNADLRD